MSQNDFNLGNQGFPSMRADMNSAYQALASNNSGTSAPSTTYSNQWWYDETNGILKIRNPANDGWVNFMTLDGVTGEYTLPPLRLEGVTATATQINTASTHYVPTGGIIMWSGSVLAIPTGWALCDGTDGTPNLQDRFVVGVGVNSTYDIGDTGGANTATLSEANMPAHTHSSGTLSGTTNETGAHIHEMTGGVGSGRSDFFGGSENDYGAGKGLAQSGYNTASAGAHVHTVDVNSGSTGSKGSGTPFNILPKYYALAYIMKT